MQTDAVALIDRIAKAVGRMTTIQSGCRPLVEWA
jgi:hypothetical protein